MDENSLRLLVAQGVSVEQIGRRFGKNPSTVSYWMGKFGLQAPNREKYTAKGGIERECLERLVDDGMSIAEIARAVDRCKSTVRHWLRRYDLKTQGRGAETAAGREAGMVAIVRECRLHGETDFVIEGRGYYRCKRCRQERVAQHRRGMKEKLVAEAGGQCVACGYDRYVGALQFHHLDPTEKRLMINAAGATLALAALREEAAKCVLLCANCHAEVERGVRTLALK
jgi:transposase-like protein